MSPERFRIFISSPGDVAEERVLANNLVRRLSDEYASRLWIEPVFWEHEPLLATDTFQKQIPPPRECEVAICVLWSRIGTRLPADITRQADSRFGPAGSRYASGTEYEFEDAANGFQSRGIPHLLVYRKTATPLVDLSDRAALLRRLEQKEALDQFVQKWFFNEKDGTIKAAFHPFATTAEFEQILDEHLRKLIGRRLEQMPALSADTAPAKLSWTSGSPFRGLEVFDFQHAPVFFGRTQAIGEVLNALRKNAAAGRAFVLVLGISGGGKSSLVRAGVLPVLTQPGVIEGTSFWRRAVLKPSDSGGNLMRALASGLLATEALPELSSDGTTSEQLAELLSQNPAAAFPLIKGGLSQAAAKLTKNPKLSQQPEGRLVLVVDQLEELFTLTKITPQDRQTFIAVLSLLARSGKVFVIATLRGDFYHHCFELPELGALKEGAGQHDLLLPSGTEIGQMIRQPARAAGLSFEEEARTKVPLDEVLKEAASRSPESLPLLEFALEELYKRRTPQGLLTYAAYQELGGVEGALAKRADEEFDALVPQVQATLTRVMRGLVSVVNGEAVARQRASMEAVASTPQARTLVEAFVQARLFTADCTEDGKAIVRVTHEALLRNWPRIKEWLDHDKELLIVRDRVSAAAARWQNESRRSDLLLSEGKPLEEAQALVSTIGEELTAAEREFVTVSERRSVARVRVKRLAIAALGALALLACLVAVVAIREKSRATQQESLATANAIRANANEREAQLASHSLYYSNFLQASERKSFDDGALFARTAMQMAEKLQLPTEDEDLASKWQLASCSRIDRFFAPCLSPSRMFETDPGKRLWCLNGDQLWAGVCGPGGEWHFERASQLKWDELAYCTSLHRLYGFVNKLLMTIDPDTGRAAEVALADSEISHLLERAIDVPPGSSFAYLATDEILLKVDLRDGSIAQRWKLPWRRLGIFAMAVDTKLQQVVLQASVAAEKVILVFDLRKSSEVLKLKRQGGMTGALAVGAGHAVFVGDDAPNAELVCITLGETPSYWKKRLPGAGGRVISVSDQGFVASDGGRVREWLFAEQKQTPLSIPSAVDVQCGFKLTDGWWLADRFGLSRRPNLTMPVDLGNRRQVKYLAIANGDENQFIAADQDGIVIRKCVNGDLVRRLPIQAEAVAADIPADRLYTRFGTRLIEYELSSGKQLGSADGIMASPILALPDSRGVLASTTTGLYRFGSSGLAKRERICDASPFFYESDPDGVQFVLSNKPLARMEIFHYDWKFGTAGKQPSIVLTDPDLVSCVHLDAELRSIVLGFKNGRIEVRSLLNLDKPKVITDGGDAVQFVDTPSTDMVTTIRMGGTLERYSLSPDGSYGKLEQRSVYDNQFLNQGIVVKPNDYILLDYSGRVTHLSLSPVGATVSRALPTGMIGRTGIIAESYFCMPQGSQVFIDQFDGRDHFELRTTSIDAGQFTSLTRNPSGDVLAGFTSANTIACWPLSGGKPTDNIAKGFSINKGISRIRFIDDRHLGVLCNFDFYVVDLNDLGEPILQKHISWPNDLGQMNEFALAQNGLFLIDENRNAVYRIDLGSEARDALPLAEPPRSLTLAGANRDILLIGGVDKVIVATIKDFRTVNTISLPQTTYYVRTTCAIPASNLVAIATNRRVFLATLSTGKYFASIPVPDFVWRLDVDPKRQELVLQGEHHFSRIPIRDLTQPTPTMAELEQRVGKKIMAAELMPFDTTELFASNPD